MVKLTDLTPQEVWKQAQAGQMEAIAQVIAAQLRADQRQPTVKVEASRRDRTLYVFLTTAQMPLPESDLQAILQGIQALKLQNIHQLTLVDGTEQRLIDRWQRSVSLLPDPRPAGGIVPRAIEWDRSQGEAGTDLRDPHHWASLQRPSPSTPFSLRARGAATEISAPSRTAQPRWLALPAIAALGFGLAAGMAQWHYSQRPSALAEPAEPASLAVPAQSAVAASAPLLAAEGMAPPAIAAPIALTIKAVGDIIPGSDYQRYRLPDDWQYLFGSIQYHLGDADITFGNFESTLTEVRRSAKDTSRGNTFAFRTPPWYASVLKEAGFDVLSVANNHSMDFFQQGFDDTIRHIEEAGMRAVGRRDEILYVEAQELTVAFIGFSTYANHNRVQDIDHAIALVQTAKAQADIVVVSFHAGKEGTDATATRDQTEYFFSENRGNVVQFSRNVIDHGADLVLGHGPHVPRALELYNNKLIAYSLGNFVGYRSLSTVGPLGTSLILQTDLDAQGNFVGGRIIPVALDKNGVPYLDDHFGGVSLVRQLTRQDFPDTPLEIDDLGYIWPR